MGELLSGLPVRREHEDRGVRESGPPNGRPAAVLTRRQSGGSHQLETGVQPDLRGGGVHAVGELKTGTPFPAPVCASLSPRCAVVQPASWSTGITNCDRVALRSSVACCIPRPSPFDFTLPVITTAAAPPNTAAPAAVRIPSRHPIMRAQFTLPGQALPTPATICAEPTRVHTHSRRRSPYRSRRTMVRCRRTGTPNTGIRSLSARARIYATTPRPQDDEENFTGFGRSVGMMIRPKKLTDATTV